MDNRLENLFLISNNIFHLSLQSSSSLDFYWKILSNMPVDMDEINFHQSLLNQSSLYECHNTPCTNLLKNNEQFICHKCHKIT